MKMVSYLLHEVKTVISKLLRSLPSTGGAVFLNVNGLPGFALPLFSYKEQRERNWRRSTKEQLRSRPLSGESRLEST